ncbi:MAG: T9SS type A sorting domain-containing protein [Bacteroidia bacterium]
MKNLLLAAFIVTCSSTFLVAQIPNASFEDGDEANVSGWKPVQGKASANTSFGFKTSFGDTIVNGRFATLQYDQTNAPIIESTFAWNKRSSMLSGTFIYIPEAASQRFTVDITYLKWQPALLSHDTIATSSSNINPFNNQKFRNYDWFIINIPIDKKGFRNNDDPDSCVIRISVDNGDYTNNNTVLLIDKLEFGEEVIASTNEMEIEQVSIYPNPCFGNFKINGLNGDESVSILNLRGQILHQSNANDLEYVLFKKGMYFIRVDKENHSIVKKLQVF